MVSEAMEDRETYQAVVSILLENEVELLGKTETEKELLLEPGSKDFNLLNDSCFILIAPFDIFGRGLYRYTFEEVCRECPDLKLDDGAVRVFINTKGTNRKIFQGSSLILWNILKRPRTKRPKMLRVNGSGRYTGESARFGNRRKRG